MRTTYDDTDREIARLVPGELAVLMQQSEILEDRNSATVDQLLAGWPMRGNAVQVDASVWSTRVLVDQEPPGLPPLPPAVERALRLIMSKPTFGNLSALHKAASRRRPEWSREYNARLDECVERTDVYLWHLGDEPAAGRCVIRALDRISNAARASIRDGLLRTAIATASAMAYEDVQRQIRHSALYVHLRDRAGTTQSSMSTWIESWAAHQERLKAGEPERVLVEEDDEITLLEAVADDRDRGVWAYAKPAPQTRIVFGVMDHLPRVSQLARERGDTPRAVVANLEGVPLPLKRLETDILQVAYDLHNRCPWLSDPIDDIVMDLAMAPAWLRLPRIIFAGAPGCGKTSLAIAICSAIGIPATEFSAAGVADGSFGGTSRQWSTGRICVPGQAVIQSRIANPAIIIDEVKKSGSSRHNGNLTDVLLAMTEATSSRGFHDPYLEAPIDLSAVSYLGTVNDPDLLPSPLRDRFRIVHVRVPDVEHVPAIVKRMVDEIRTERGIDPAFMPDLAPDEIDLLADRWKPSSLRGLRGRVELLLRGRDRLATRN